MKMHRAGSEVCEEGEPRCSFIFLGEGRYCSGSGPLMENHVLEKSMESVAWCPNGMSWVWELGHANPEQGFSEQFLAKWKRKETTEYPKQLF